MRDGEAQVDGSGRFAGIFACDLPDAPGLRLVAGACAADGVAARALIAARLAEHGVTAVQCEALMPCEDWAAACSGDTQGAWLSAALRRAGQVSFLDHLVALPPRRQGGSGVGSAARSAAKGNFIGFVVAAAFDVHAFFQSEDPEKNWGGLLGKLAGTFVKVWAAGFAGVLIAAAVASTMAAAPVILMVGLGGGGLGGRW